MALFVTTANGSWASETVPVRLVADKLTLRLVNPAPLPQMVPARYVAVWPLPMRMRFASAATPGLPMSMLLLPVTRKYPAK